MYKALLVDDEYMILEGLKQIIPWNKLGFEVVKTAKRALEALEYIKENEIDLLITDVTMPKMNGIDLVRLAKEIQPDLSVLILSGYQEFEYVKQGMELGVKGYLVKPVNKEELVEKVTQIRDELEEQVVLESQKELYQESMIQKWLNDEMNEDEYEHLISQSKKAGVTDFSVIMVSQMESQISLKSYAQKYKQIYIVETEVDHAYQTVIVYQGSRSDLTLFVRGIEDLFKDIVFRIILGELVTEWENVYESYEKAKKLAQFQAFYGPNEASQMVLNITETDDAEVTLHFLSFNKALIIGDMPTIKEELHHIYIQMAEFGYTPENVRHVTFLLFTDMYRQFSTLDKAMYDQTLTKIHSSNNVEELQNWLLQILDAIFDNPDVGKRYSDLVKGAIDVISIDYQKDLSLKSVAEQLHVNPVYLGQLFSKETERSFSQYLNQSRIKKAQYGLLNTNKPINEVGYEVGYNNTTYFFKMFRKLNGLTPKEFREKYMSNYHRIESEDHI